MSIQCNNNYDSFISHDMVQTRYGINVNYCYLFFGQSFPIVVLLSYIYVYHVDHIFQDNDKFRKYEKII
jgi:hypothetical protein